MKQHQVIELLHKVVAENQNFTTWTVSTPHLVALVTHAIEAEREACAKIIEDSYETTTPNQGIPEDWLLTLSEAIRARGEA